MCFGPLQNTREPPERADDVTCTSCFPGKFLLFKIPEVSFDPEQEVEVPPPFPLPLNVGDPLEGGHLKRPNLDVDHQRSSGVRLDVTRRPPLSNVDVSTNLRTFCPDYPLEFFLPLITRTSVFVLMDVSLYIFIYSPRKGLQPPVDKRSRSFFSFFFSSSLLHQNLRSSSLIPTFCCFFRFQAVTLNLTSDPRVSPTTLEETSLHVCLI